MVPHSGMGTYQRGGTRWTGKGTGSNDPTWGLASSEVPQGDMGLSHSMKAGLETEIRAPANGR